jgi:elongation factor P hydroxylase
MTKHDCQDLICLFNALFQETEKTILVGNGDEPLYLPGTPFHRVIFKADYFASALHEIAHWCIAGEVRRQQVDYGYWYYPEGRNTEQQQLFESAEVKPQALECLFAQAAGSRFIVSQDNFSDDPQLNQESFAKKVTEQAQRFLIDGLPDRAALFRNRLVDFYSESITRRHHDSALMPAYLFRSTS